MIVFIKVVLSINAMIETYDRVALAVTDMVLAHAFNTGTDYGLLCRLIV